MKSLLLASAVTCLLAASGAPLHSILIGPLIATQQAELTASDPGAGDLFGESVSISGDTVVVGAHRDSGAVGFYSGSAYVFVRSGTSWSEQHKLTASDAAIGDRFGKSVSIWGDTAVVSAAFDADAGTSSGSAYVFVRSGTSWSEQQKTHG